MHKSENGASTIVIILVITLIIAGAGWLFIRNNSHNKPETSQSNISPGKQTCDSPVEGQKSWETIASVNNVFSICIPGGWTVNLDAESDSISVPPPFDILQNRSPTINQEDIGGGDGTRDEMAVFKAESKYQGWTDPENSVEASFTLNDGTEGVRYYTKYSSAGEGIGAVKGEEDYEYLFEKNDKFISAHYTIHPDTEKQLETIESVIKTLKIN